MGRIDDPGMDGLVLIADPYSKTMDFELRQNSTEEPIDKCKKLSLNKQSTSWKAWSSF